MKEKLLKETDFYAQGGIKYTCTGDIKSVYSYYSYIYIANIAIKLI